MASDTGNTSAPMREELLACLIPALQSLPLHEAPSGLEVDIEALAEIIIEHLGDSGYVIKARHPKAIPPPRR